MDTTQTAAASATTSAEEIERDSLIFALLYGQRYALRLGRFYSRIAGFLRFCEVVMGGAAFVSFFMKSPEAAAYSGLAVAIIGAINIAYDPAAKAKDAAIEEEKFGRAHVATGDLTIDQLRRSVRELQATPRREIEALRMPVWRDVVLQIGRECPKEPVKPSEWMISLMA